MNKHILLFAAIVSASAAVSAHVSLQEGQAEVARPYRAVFRVGHGCDGSPTTGITVQLPTGFAAANAEPKPGWQVRSEPAAITWTAANDASALPASEKGEFVLTGSVPGAGPMWFKVRQTCKSGAIDWADVPASGTATADMKTPAALLQVLSPTEFARTAQAPKVEAAWVRGTVPGQSGTGAFMRLTAREATQLVGVATPVAGTAEVHEMKMEGDVMRMRPLPRLDLPAGQVVELKPGGYHLMLQELKQPLTPGTTVPVTLLFRNAKGVESRLELKLPVALQPPGGGSAPAAAHKH